MQCRDSNISDGEEDNGDNNTDTSARDIDFHAVSLTEGGEIQQLSGLASSNVCDENVACATEINSMTSDLDTRQLVDDTTETLTDSDVRCTFDSEINPSQETAMKSSNDDAADDLEADKTVADSPRVLVHEIADSDDSQPTAQSSNEQQSRPETMLSWSNPPHDSTASKTKCAVEFENSVIFDLDVE